MTRDLPEKLLDDLTVDAELAGIDGTGIFRRVPCILRTPRFLSGARHTPTQTPRPSTLLVGARNDACVDNAGSGRAGCARR